MVAIGRGNRLASRAGRITGATLGGRIVGRIGKAAGALSANNRSSRRIESANGWVASGMTELLLELPAGADRDAIMAGYKKLMDGLLKVQITTGTDPGAWNQARVLACSSQKASGSRHARSWSRSYSARLLICDDAANAGGGGNTRLSFSTLVMFGAASVDMGISTWGSALV